MARTLNLLLAALFLIAPLTEALHFDGPKPTALRNGGGGHVQYYQMPDTPVQTTAPDIKRAELFKRDHYESVLIGPDNTCGYFNGNASQYFTCVYTTYRCDFYLSFYSTQSTSAGVLRCCPPTGTCSAAVVTQCIDSKAYAAGTTCLDDNCVVCTSSAFPFCNGATFPALGVKNYLCGFSSESTYATALQSYINQFPDRLYITSSYLAPDLTTSTPSPTTTTPPSTTPPSTTTTVPPVSSSCVSNCGGGSSTPVGAIVGGVVGGVAVIAAIVGLIWFMRRRKRQANENQQTPPVHLQQFPSPTDPKAPYTTQTSPVQPPYYQPQPGYQQPVQYYQQQGYQAQQPYGYGQQYPPAQQYSPYQAEHETAAASPLPFDKTPTDTVGGNRLSQAPTMAMSPNPGSQHSPNPQHGRSGAFEIEA